MIPDTIIIGTILYKEGVMKRLILSLVLLSITFTVAGLDANTAIAQDAAGAAGLYKQGKAEFMKFTPEGFEQAIATYNKAIAIDANYAPAYAGLAEVYSFMGFYRYLIKDDYEKYYNDSYKNMEKALKLGPDLEATQVALAYSYYHLSREKEAIAAARGILAKDPNNAEAYYILWAASGGNPNAPEIRKAIELNPKYVPAYIGLGNAYYQKRRSFNQAAAQYKKAVEIAPSAQLHNYLGTALNYQGYYQKAVNQFQKAIELNPNYAPAYMNLGITYFYMKQFANTVSSEQKAISLNPNTPEAYFFLAQGYEKQNKRSEAIANYKKFLEISLGQDRYKGYGDTAKQRIAALGGG